MDMSYECLFSGDFSDRHAYCPYARYSSELLIEELDHYFQGFKELLTAS